MHINPNIEKPIFITKNNVHRFCFYILHIIYLFLFHFLYLLSFYIYYRNIDGSNGSTLQSVANAETASSFSADRMF